MITYHKSFSILSMLILIVLTSCAGGQTPVIPTSTVTIPPTATFTSSPTLTPTPTFTPTATATPRLPVAPGTQMPVPGLALSADNLDQVVELARWGNGIITDATYSPNGKLIASGSTLGVSIYESDTLKEILYFETTLTVNSVVFSPDGETLATGLDDKTVQTWSVKDGSLLKTFEYPKDEKGTEKEIDEASKEDVASIAFSPDGKLLAAGSSDGMVVLWQVSDGSLLRSDKESKKLGKYITRVLFSPDSQYLFYAPFTGNVHMLQVSDGKEVKSFSGHSHLIFEADLSLDGKVLAVLERGLYGQGEYDLILWNVEDGKQMQKIKGGDYYSTKITRIGMSPDSQYVAASWNDYSIKIWSVTSGALQNDFQDLVPKDYYYYDRLAVKFSPDSKSLLAAGRNIMAMWNVANGSLVQNIKTKSEPIYKVDISTDGKSLAAVEGLNIDLWQISDGSLIPTKEPLQSNGTIDFSLDGNSIATGLFKNSAQIMPLSDQGIRKSFEMEKKEYIRGVAFSPDGKVLALGASSPAGKVELRQVSDGLLLATISLTATFGFNNMEFSPSGEFLGVSIHNQTILIRVSDGKVIKSTNKGDCLAFSPDNTLLAVGAAQDNTLLFWRVPSGELIFNLKDRPEAVSSVRFSPDGKLLMAGMADGAIEVWNVADGTLLTTWQAHSQGITDFAFSPGGDLLFSSSYDGTIRVWGIKP